MNKFTKRLLSLLIVAVMIGALSLTAIATGTTSLPAISVQVGDKMVSFQDATPEILNGRTFVPVRAIVEALGATVSYDSATSTATAVKGDTTVTLVSGEKLISVTKNGSTQSLEMDVAAYIQNNRMIVPARFVAQAFDCYVGWDADSRSVLILDIEGLLSSNNAQYTLMDKYLDYANEFSLNYAVSGTFNFSVEIDDEGTKIPVVSNGTINAVYDSNAVNLELGMTTDITKIVAQMTAEDALDPQTTIMLNMLKNINIEYILNISKGMIYIRSSLLSTVLGEDEETWFSIDMKTLLSDSVSDTSYSELLATNNDDISFEDYVLAACKMYPLTDVETAKTMAEVLTFINTVFSDAAFVKNGDTYTTSKSLVEDGVTGAFSFSLTLNNDAVTSFALTMNATGDDKSTMDLKYSMNASNKMDISMTLVMPDLLNFSFTAALQYTKATAPAATAPEAGSTIVPFDPSEGIVSITPTA